MTTRNETYARNGTAEVHEMFYWFFRNEQVGIPTRPLVIWLSGGPGASSMGPLFESIGPL